MFRMYAMLRINQHTQMPINIHLRTHTYRHLYVCLCACMSYSCFGGIQLRSTPARVAHATQPHLEESSRTENVFGHCRPTRPNVHRDKVKEVSGERDQGGAVHTDSARCAHITKLSTQSEPASHTRSRISIGKAWCACVSLGIASPATPQPGLRACHPSSPNLAPPTLEFWTSHDVRKRHKRAVLMRVPPHRVCQHQSPPHQRW